jgi:hypothetical protein
MQDGKPVSYYSKKLNSAQMNYTTIDKELLCIVATLRKFRSMLLGAELHVHTDHKNILSIGDSSQQHLHWISHVDEYGLESHYVEGPCNVIPDTFLRLLHSTVSSPLVGKKATYVGSDSASGNRNESSHSLLMDDRDITDCLMNLPCFPSRKKGRPTKHRIFLKQYQMNETNPSCHLTLMIPLKNSVISTSPKTWLKTTLWTWRTSKKDKTMMKISCSQQLSTQSGTLVRLSMMLTTSCVILNQVII